MTKVIFLYLIVYLIVITGGVKMNPEDSKDGPPISIKNEEMGDGLNQDFVAMMNKCNETFKIDMSYLQSLNESGSFPDETQKMPKCFMMCMLQETGIMNNDYEFNATRTAMVFAGSRNGRQMTDLEDMASGCADRKETCKCEKSYQFIRCFMEKEIEKYEEGQSK